MFLLWRSKRTRPSGLVRPGQEFKTYLYCDGALNIKVVTGVALFLGEPDTMVELCAIGRAIKLEEWVAHFREESGYAQTQPAIIFTDSGSVPNRQTRHLRRRVLCIKQALARNIAVLKFVPGNLNCADLLTKPLGRVLFESHSKNMMGELYSGYLHSTTSTIIICIVG